MKNKLSTQNITSWRTTIIGVILLLSAGAIWYIPTMESGLKTTLTVMLVTAALVAFGLKDESVFTKTNTKEE